jgi:hypothetical protein
MYNPNNNPLETDLSPEQQRFADLLLVMDFRDALKEMDLPVEKVRHWLCNSQFSAYLRELQAVLADDVYRQVIAVAKDMLHEIRNLQEHLSIPQRTEALECIVDLVSKAQEKCRFKGSASHWDDYMDAESWRAHVAGEDEDEDEYEDEEEEEGEQDISSGSKEPEPTETRAQANTFPPEHFRVLNPFDFFTPEQWEEFKKSGLEPPNGVVYDESAPSSTGAYIPDPNMQILASEPHRYPGDPFTSEWDC